MTLRTYLYRNNRFWLLAKLLDYEMMMAMRDKGDELLDFLFRP